MAGYGPNTHLPRTLILSSDVADGSVGGRISSFALQRLGIPVWFVPTITLACHPGRKPSAVRPTQNDDLKHYLDDMLRLAQDTPLGAVLTGYLGSAEQPAIIADFLDALKKIQPDAKHICDPVLGDTNGLYVDPELAANLRDKLWARADIATPNVFELNWLTGNAKNQETAEKPQTATDLTKIAQSAPVPIVVTTSTPGLMVNHIGNLLTCPDEAPVLVEHLAMPKAPHGTGDVFAALLCGHIVAGLSPEAATMKASSAIFELASRAAKANTIDLPIVREQLALEHPVAMVTRRLLAPAHATRSKNKAIRLKPSPL